jgi:hypothetical protein
MEKRAWERLIEKVEGLITLEQRKETKSLQSGYVDGRWIGAPENVGQPVHCLRTVSQRSLSVPVSFLSNHVTPIAGSDIFAAVVTDPTDGAIPNAGLGGTNPARFYDANVQAERQRVDELVLYAMRAKVSAQATAAPGGPGTPFNYGRYAKTLEDMVKMYCVVRCYSTADSADPWWDDTPLYYFDRPRGEFIYVPPVYWRDRDPHCELDVRPADFGGAAGALPELATADNPLDVQLSILIESLWTPNPEACGKFWPGAMCPTKHIKGTPGYRGK